MRIFCVLPCGARYWCGAVYLNQVQYEVPLCMDRLGRNDPCISTQRRTYDCSLCTSAVGWMPKSRHQGSNWLPWYVIQLVSAVPAFRLYGLPCVWKASLVWCAHPPVRPLAEIVRAESSTATHGASTHRHRRCRCRWRRCRWR